MTNTCGTDCGTKLTASDVPATVEQMRQLVATRPVESPVRTIDYLGVLPAAPMSPAQEEMLRTHWQLLRDISAAMGIPKRFFKESTLFPGRHYGTCYKSR